MWRIILLAIWCACTPSEPLGPRPDPVTPSGKHLPRWTSAPPDAGVHTAPPGAVAFVPDQKTADRFMEPTEDAGTDALLPTEAELPDAGLIPDAGTPMSP